MKIIGKSNVPVGAINDTMELLEDPEFENSGDADLQIDLPAFPTDDVPPAPLEDSTASFSDDSLGTQTSNTVDPYVTHVVLNRRLTSGFDGNGKPGDEGFTVVLEPGNANGQYVPLAGAVEVVAIDVEMEGPESRIGHWNFTANETSQNLRTSLQNLPTFYKSIRDIS